MRTPRQQIELFVSDLAGEESFDKEEEIWVFSDGSASAVCTNSAKRIAREFGGEVFGYLSTMNPAAEIGGTACEGHDFAVISGRWIVDYWAFQVASLIQTPVLDLEDVEDIQLAARFYGNRGTWEKVAI